MTIILPPYIGVIVIKFNRRITQTVPLFNHNRFTKVWRNSIHVPIYLRYRTDNTNFKAYYYTVIRFFVVLNENLRHISPYYSNSRWPVLFVMLSSLLVNHYQQTPSRLLVHRWFCVVYIAINQDTKTICR